MFYYWWRCHGIERDQFNVSILPVSYAEYIAIIELIEILSL